MDDKQVADLLTRALSAVDTAKVPEDLREAAFKAAISLMTGGSSAAPPAPPAPPATQQQGGKQSGSSSGSELIDRIAEELDVEPAMLRRLFADKNGEPELIVKSSKLPKPKAAAAADLALLIMASRQAAGIDDYTEAEVLRGTVKRYGKFDSANFATQMKSLDNFILTDGKGASVKRKLTHPGMEAAGELVEKYTAED